MKILNYYLHGGVEQHYDGSFTMYGTIEAITDELFKIRYYDYSFTEARKLFKEAIKEKAIELSQFVNHD